VKPLFISPNKSVSGDTRGLSGVIPDGMHRDRLIFTACHLRIKSDTDL